MEQLKWKHPIGDHVRFNGSRIIELEDKTGAVVEVPSEANLDLKYQLFLEWMHHNQQNQPSSALLTDDEVSSWATNSDDSGSDVFLDTESDFPVIILSVDENEQTNGSDHNVIAPVADRVDTPIQLSVCDFDCGASDVTVGSQISAISDASSQASKRKAKHNKGRAPPIPTLSPANASPNDENGCKLIAANISLSLSRASASVAGSAHETDIWFVQPIVRGVCSALTECYRLRFSCVHHNMHNVAATVSLTCSLSLSCLIHLCRTRLKIVAVNSLCSRITQNFMFTSYSNKRLIRLIHCFKRLNTVSIIQHLIQLIPFATYSKPT